MQYFYDAANRLTNVVESAVPSGNSASLFYDDLGRRTKLVLPNGINVLYFYDTASRLTNITYQGAATNRIVYSYDQLGSRVAQASPLANYLVPSAVASGTYNNANQQLTFGSYNMLYDANGNVTNITNGTVTNQLVWNARNQLTNMTGAVNATYRYDGLGRRVENISQRYLYDGLDAILSKQGPAKYLNFRGLAIDEPWQQAKIINNTTNSSAYLADALGSIVALTDTGKVIKTEYDYEPFGATTTTGAGNNSSYKFTAREDDGTGLYYYRARYYHPTLGRFVSEDEFEYAGGDINLYGYVFGDPINGFDPIGLMAWYDRWLENASNFSAGMGDNLSLGLTRYVRNQFEFYEGTVDPCSGWYSGGEWTGTGLSLAMGISGGIEAAGVKGAGKEFSHWIPARYNGPRSIWNGNYVTPVEHALSDPYRYRFMPKAWKLANEPLNVVEQQWNRIPNAINGTGLGGGYGAAGQSANGCGCQ